MNLQSKFHLTTSAKIFLFSAFVGFYILSVLIHLNYYPLNGDEPRRAIITIEMRHSGNYIMPTSMGWKYYNKPPVYNWLISACMFLTGLENEIPVRLPSLIAILLWGIINYWFLKKYIHSETAALSSFFLLTGLGMFLWGLNNGGEIDIFYSFIVYLQIISIFHFNQRKKWAALYLMSYLFCAIGLLTKGFPSILFEGLTLLALCVFNRSIKVLFRWQHLLGIILFFTVVGTYLYAYSFYSSPGRLLVNLLKESLDKSLVGDYPERLVRRAIEYPFVFCKILLPWSLFFILLFKKRRFKFTSYPLFRFSVLFILFNIPIYWFTGHPRMRYSYMFVPFFMTVLALIFYEFKAAYPDIIKKLLKWLTILVIAGICVVFILPFLFTVDYVWYTIAVLAVGLYLFFYKKMIPYAIWYFGFGIILFRFLFASVYLPARYKNLKQNYKKDIALLAKKNDFKPVAYYQKPDTLDLSINLKVAKFHFETIPAIPFLAYQIPYYYYKSSGNIVTFDTILRKNINYIALQSSIRDITPDTLYSFVNEEGKKMVLFRIR